MDNAEIKVIIDFIDFCIERDSDTKQVLELMFGYYVKDNMAKGEG